MTLIKTVKGFYLEAKKPLALVLPTSLRESNSSFVLIWYLFDLDSFGSMVDDDLVGCVTVA